jgi:hypothetical protein
MTTTFAKPLNIIIVEKTGVLKMHAVKDFKEDELYKKCGFKSPIGFNLQVNNEISKNKDIKYTWKVKVDGIHYFISLYGKVAGRENNENKYDFPPPVDKILFFGNCVLIAQKKTKNNKEYEYEYVHLTVSIWNKIYEKLFGGFENLKDTEKADEEEEDELNSIPKKYKTKEGYLKDGFVVSSSSLSSSCSSSSSSSSCSEYEDDNDNDADNLFLTKGGKDKSISKSKSINKSISKEKKDHDDDDTEDEKSDTVSSDEVEVEEEDSVNIKMKKKRAVSSKVKKSNVTTNTNPNSKKKQMEKMYLENIEELLENELCEEEYDYNKK